MSNSIRLFLEENGFCEFVESYKYVRHFDKESSIVLDTVSNQVVFFSRKKYVEIFAGIFIADVMRHVSENFSELLCIFAYLMELVGAKYRFHPVGLSSRYPEIKNGEVLMDYYHKTVLIFGKKKTSLFTTLNPLVSSESIDFIMERINQD